MMMARTTESHERPGPRRDTPWPAILTFWRNQHNRVSFSFNELRFHHKKQLGASSQLLSPLPPPRRPASLSPPMGICSSSSSTNAQAPSQKPAAAGGAQKSGGHHQKPASQVNNPQHAHVDRHGQLVDDKTGGRVFPEAEKHRKKAHAEGDKMHKASGDSQTAWKRGDKGEAKRLSDLSKKHRAHMEEENRKAVAAILSQQPWKDSPKIDLHGLYVEEAKHAVQDFLDHHTKGGKFKDVEIVVGAGHHSKDHKSHIGPAVESLLKAKHLAYHHPDQHHGGVGALEVKIR